MYLAFVALLRRLRGALVFMTQFRSAIVLLANFLMDVALLPFRFFRHKPLAPSKSDTALLDDLRTLDQEVLAVIVAEGDARINAQLAVAATADQRALTLAGYTATGATAAITGFFYLLLTQSQRAGAFVSVIALAIGLLVSTGISVHSIRSQKFFLPGSRPSLWRRDNWTNDAGPKTLKNALIEQCNCLEIAIVDNAKCAEKAGDRFNRAMDCAFVSITFAVLFVLLFPN